MNHTTANEILGDVCLNDINEMDVAKLIIKVFKAKGYEAYMCGGCVRDMLLGKPSHDIDIATNCPMHITESLFKTVNIGQSKTFGLVIVTFYGFSFEVANFRTDGTYSDGRHPDDIKIAQSFKEDCERRDFTINAMAMCENEGILDYHKGMQDLGKGILRTVGNAYMRFEEDYLRMLRAVRFCAKYNLEMDYECKQAIKKNSFHITEVSVERIFSELYKMACLSGPKFAKCISIMYDVKLLEEILHEIHLMGIFYHSVTHHPERAIARNKVTYETEAYNPNIEYSEDWDIQKSTVFDHIIAALEVQLEKNNPLLNFCVLLHDTGKIKTFMLKEDGRITYHQHDRVSEHMNREIGQRLKMPKSMIETIVFVSTNHMAFNQFLNTRYSKIAKRVQHKDFEYLLKTCVCDNYCSEYMFDEEIWIKIIKRIDETKHRMENTLYKKVNGKYIMELLNIPSGEIIGKILEKTRNACIDQNITTFEKLDKFITGYYSSIK
jgi:tRNA nucleotidyltransferase/poly(A) polymerase